jgi:hypothetical protein
MEQRKELVDPAGQPVPHRLTGRERLRTISSKTKFVVVAFVAVVAAVAALLGNIETIRSHLRPKPAPPSVPLIVVKLKNDLKKDVQVAARGDFILWLPGPDGYHTMGKYEFRLLGGKSPQSEEITVSSNSTTTVYAKIMDQEVYGRILERADCDISLGIRASEGGLKFSDNLPFTKEAIAKYFVAVDVGAP